MSHMGVVLHPPRPDDHAGVLAVAESLPEWFDVDARGRAIPSDLRHQDGFVAISDGQVVGFILLYVFEGRLNVAWLGVRRDHQRRGLGMRLLAATEDKAWAMGLAELATHTLGDSVDYPPYARTRAFYAKQGFVIRQRNQTDNPGCPEELLLTKPVSFRAPVDFHRPAL